MCHVLFSQSSQTHVHVNSDHPSHTHTHTHAGMLTDPSDSLFNYLPYQNFSVLSNSQFTPTFNPDTSTASFQLRAICADDPFCLYDGLVTGNVGLGAVTKEIVDECRRVRELSVGRE